MNERNNRVFPPHYILPLNEGLNEEKNKEINKEENKIVNYDDNKSTELLSLQKEQNQTEIIG